MLKISNTTAILSLLSLTSVTLFYFYHLKQFDRIKKKEKKILRLPIIEICLSDIQSLQQVIQEGNCNSIELCSNRLEGGVTASIGLINQCIYHLRNNYYHINTSIDLQVLIRPRPGGFIYSDDEFEIIQKDILAAKIAGVNGIVFGAINKIGGIDIDKMKVIRRLTEGMTLTFHRAFDILDHDDESDITLEMLLDVIISLGCDRLLTSGGKTENNKQHDSSSSSSSSSSNILSYNILGLQRLVKHANNRIIIIAASGITSNNVEEIIYKTHVQAIHVGKAVTEIISDDIIPSITISSIESNVQQNNLEMNKSLKISNNNSEMIQWNRVSKSLLSDLVDKSYCAWHCCIDSSIPPSHSNRSIHDAKTISSPLIHQDSIEENSEETSDYVYISSKSISTNSLK